MPLCGDEDAGRAFRISSAPSRALSLRRNGEGNAVVDLLPKQMRRVCACSSARGCLLLHGPQHSYRGSSSDCWLEERQRNAKYLVRWCWCWCWCWCCLLFGCCTPQSVGCFVRSGDDSIQFNSIRCKATGLPARHRPIAAAPSSSCHAPFGSFSMGAVVLAVLVVAGLIMVLKRMLRLCMGLLSLSL